MTSIHGVDQHVKAVPVIGLITSLLLIPGCIVWVGGASSGIIEPPVPWKGPTTSISVDRNEALPMKSGIPVGFTSIPPEQITSIVRSFCEPTYGPLNYQRIDLPSRRIVHLFRSPRFDLSNDDRNYKWLQVRITHVPIRRISIIDVSENWREYSAVETSPHGWPQIHIFPPPTIYSITGIEQERILRAVIRRLNDPSAYVTYLSQWDKLSEDIELRQDSDR